MTTGATGETGDRRIAAGIRKAYEKYVVFHSDYAEAQAGTMALWTMHTHVYDIADATPYILVTAPTSEAGKSRVFGVARNLVRNPYVVVDPTPATLFHAIDDFHPTLLVDEADMITENKALRVVINAGFQPGTPVGRSGKQYDVHCPKIFSGISGVKPPLTEATLSRCVQVLIRRKAPHEHAERLVPRLAAIELAPLAAEVAAWAARARGELELANPAMPSGLSDRQQDAWAPMLAIADMLGGTWPADARRWAVELYKAIPKPADPAVQILRDVKRILDGFEGTRIPSATLAAARNELLGRDYEEDLSAVQLGRRLSGFGIHPDPSPFRMGGKNSPTMRGYSVRRGGKYLAQWHDTFVRYGVEADI